MNQQKVLIIGNSGKTGQRVERHLQQAGIATRGVSRSTTIAFDWNDQSTWRAALNGMSHAYITFQPDLAVPGAAAIIGDFARAAVASGLHHLVLLSGRGEPGAQLAEQEVINSGLDWNVIRASWFAQNFSEGFMLHGIQAGELVLPATTTLEPFIDIDDIADVAAATLTGSAARNRLYELTGPRLMSFADCMQAIGAATGQAIALRQIPLDDYIQHLADQGLPKDVQWLMRELFGVVFDGRNESVTNGVEQALGRPATDFNQYVSKTLTTAVWPHLRAAANH